LGCQTTTTQLVEATRIYNPETGELEDGAVVTDFKTTTLNTVLMKMESGEGAGHYEWDSDGGGLITVGQKAQGMDGASAIDSLVQGLLQMSAQREATRQAEIANPPLPSQDGMETAIIGILERMSTTGTIPALPTR
jgi:hypothetical protein